MPSKDEWKTLLTEASKDNPEPKIATDYLEKMSEGGSKPISIKTEDDEIYIVKGRQNGRMIVNEQVVGFLGEVIGAPVPSVAIIDIPEIIIKENPTIQYMQSGLSHGSLYMEGYSGRKVIEHTDVPENKSRFAKLAVLYSWIMASDRQIIYEEDSKLAISVDHGHFFPGGPNWQASNLQNNHQVTLDPFFDPCNLTSLDFEPISDILKAIQCETIAKAVARPPSIWGLSEDDRIELAIYLNERHTNLVSLLDGNNP